MSYVQGHSNYRQLIASCWLQVVLVTLVLTVSRLLFLALESESQIIQDNPWDLLKAVFIGLRFDLRATTIVFAPILLTGLILASTRFYPLVAKFIPKYSYFIFFLVITASIGNYYYFQTYNNHFDIFVFGLFEDDTQNVLTSIWQDYPVVFALLLTTVFTYLLVAFNARVLKLIARKQWKLQSSLGVASYIVITLVVYVFFARGSLGTFPLKQYHANVSSYQVFNKSTPNALIALSWAHKKHKKSARFASVSEQALKDKMRALLGQDNAIYHTKNNAYLAKSPPNVVLALMESMGTNLLLEDNKAHNDLLGSLREPFNRDFVFSRFLASTNTTIDSIVAMLFHSNVNSISVGNAQKTPLTGSAFLPYKEADYKVVYITGGSATWRNLSQYLLHQGVDEFYSQIDIAAQFPEAAKFSGTWGVPDNYTFEFAQHILAQNTQPVMLVLLTQTNHSPYQVPDNYQAKPLAVSEKIAASMSLPKEKAQKVLETYQYAADALGNFIHKVKNTNKNTIIAATGDHRLRSYRINYPDDLAAAYAVPFYLHIPEQILNRIPHRFEPTRLGSHRDILPTLYAFSLSDAPYTSLGGRNLLAPEDIHSPMAINEKVVFTPDGVINVDTPEFSYPWQDSSSLAIKKQAKTNVWLSFFQEYGQLQSLFINAQVAGFTRDNDDNESVVLDKESNLALKRY